MKNSLEKELLLEKKRHNLEEKITSKEKELLKKNYPIQKIIGFINFDDVHIDLEHNVFIPRYETEEVVQESLKYINKNSKVLDLCCGSGYIGLSIKKKTNSNVTLSDVSVDAIKQSQKNMQINNLKVNIIHSNLFEKINDKFDVIISNPPYVSKVKKLDRKILNFEPHNALFAGQDGNDFYKKIIKKAPKYLNQNGLLILEISEDNLDFIKAKGFKIKNDINNKPRIAIKKF